MKSILNFRAGALVLGLVLAFAGSAFTQAEDANYVDKSRATAWFATHPNGDLIEPKQMVDPDLLCDGDVDICAKQYNIDENGEPTSATGLEAKQDRL